MATAPRLSAFPRQFDFSPVLNYRRQLPCPKRTSLCVATGLIDTKDPREPGIKLWAFPTSSLRGVVETAETKNKKVWKDLGNLRTWFICRKRRARSLGAVPADDISPPCLLKHPFATPGNHTTPSRTVPLGPRRLTASKCVQATFRRASAKILQHDTQL